MAASTHHASTGHPAGDHELPPVANTLMTFVVLFMLAILALVVGFSNMGEWKVLANLAVSALQTTVLALFFMDLRKADPLTWLAVASSIFWLGLLFLFTLTDMLTRHIAVL